MEETNRNPLTMMRDAGYSEKASLLLAQQLNFGTMENPDLTAKYQSDCGDMLILYLKLGKKNILNAQYEYIGCRGLQAAASALTEMVKGMSLSEASEIEFQDILNCLEGIPVSKYECIHLALNTLKEGTKGFL